MTEHRQNIRSQLVLVGNTYGRRQSRHPALESPLCDTGHITKSLPNSLGYSLGSIDQFPRESKWSLPSSQCIP